MRPFAMLALVACGAGAPEPAAPPTPPVEAKPADKPIDKPTPGLPRMVVKTGSADDDLPHTRERLAPVLASASTCVPTVDGLDVILDTWDGHLVGCARVMTRRGVSVMFDGVLYACWNLDPKTAKLDKRQDLARTYFDCRDGTCKDSGNEVVSYDGKSRVRLDSAHVTLSVEPRSGGAGRGLDAPPEFANAELVRGEMTAVGRAIVMTGDKDTYVLDDTTGSVIATVPGRIVQVLDDGHVLIGSEVIADDDTPAIVHATIIDLAKHTATAVKPSEGALLRAVYFGGKAYAIAGTRLLELDPKTLAVTGHHALAMCP